MHLKKGFHIRAAFYHKERLPGFCLPPPRHAHSENDMEIDFFVLYVEPIY